MKIKIGKHIIGDNKPCFIIAEMSGNHNMDIKREQGPSKFSVPPFPGKQNNFLHNFDSCNFLQRACSLPPLPINPIFM